MDDLFLSQKISEDYKSCIVTYYGEALIAAIIEVFDTHLIFFVNLLGVISACFSEVFQNIVSIAYV
jgi:hypothetical protein